MLRQAENLRHFRFMFIPWQRQKALTSCAVDTVTRRFGIPASRHSPTPGLGSKAEFAARLNDADSELEVVADLREDRLPLRLAVRSEVRNVPGLRSPIAAPRP